jgi:hypothetical protein
LLTVYKVAREFESSPLQQGVLDVCDLKLGETAHLTGNIRVKVARRSRPSPRPWPLQRGTPCLPFEKEDEMSEQEGETVLLDKLAGSLLDYVEDEDALDGALRLREDLLDKRLMMTARLQHKMVDNLADGQEHRAQAQQFVQSMIDKFRVEVILDS